jgi:F0F1-type ATP synthase assembly protein I
MFNGSKAEGSPEACNSRSTSFTANSEFKIIRINPSVLKYSSLATQMALTIGLGVWGGRKLDYYFQNEKPILTLVFSVLGLAVSLIVVIRSVSKK